MTMAAIGSQTPPKIAQKPFSIWGAQIKGSPLRPFPLRARAHPPSSILAYGGGAATGCARSPVSAAAGGVTCAHPPAPGTE